MDGGWTPETISQDYTNVTINLSTYPSIDSIPNEILALIFELGCFADEEPDLHFRALIEKISWNWRETAHHCPSLWSVYHLSQGNLDPLIYNLPNYLERSGDYPLSIYLNCSWDPARTEDVMELFLPHCKRWRLLSIVTPRTDIFHFLHGIQVPQLETLQLCYFSPQRFLHLDPGLFDGHLPSLRYLALRNISFIGTTLPLENLRSLDVRGDGVWPEYAELKELIGGSTALRNLTLHVTPEAVLEAINPQDGYFLDLPALRTFHAITTEGLTPYLAALIRVFSFPSVESFVVEDTSVPPPTYNMVQYSRTGSALYPGLPSLSVRSCSLYHAWSCLNLSRNIGTLELDNVNWPHWSNVMTVLAGLPSLENMIIVNIDTTAAFSSLGQPVHPLKMPSLKRFEISAKKHRCTDDELDFAKFVGAFDVPKLQSLAVRDISSGQWKHLVVAFTRKVGKYPVLQSLIMNNIQGPLDALPDLSWAFPNLRNLTLIRVSVNPIIRHLVPGSAMSSPTIPWPNLKWLGICGDPDTSISLLRRIIILRPRSSPAFCLDGHFHRDREFWRWLKENADVILVSTIGRPGELLG